MAALTAYGVLDLIGGQPTVRAYLRGVEEGSETDQDAQRAMLAAIHAVRGSGVRDAMAAHAPELYAQACLLLCRMWTDAEDGAADAILRQYNGAILLLRANANNKD